MRQGGMGILTMCVLAGGGWGASGGAVWGQVPLTGNLSAHDPSAVIRDTGGVNRYFATGMGLVSRSSVDLRAWDAGPSIFGTTIPGWTTQAVPGFAGEFWAPDVAYFNNRYHVYYSVSTFGSQRSAIGLATSASLNPADADYGWTDQGAVIQSNTGSGYNAIDPAIFQDTTGRAFMTFGSYWNGIYVAEIDLSTGKRLASNPNPVFVAGRGGNSIEASALMRRGDWYYLVSDWGQCCAGVDSTYELRYGRSLSPTGPFVDMNGVNLRNGGGTLLLDDAANQIGPGHFSLLQEGGRNYFTYHYYDGLNGGAATLGMRELFWGADGWLKLMPTAGDTQRDSDVDFSDLEVLAGNFNVTAGMGWLNGDFTGDGAVNADDLALMEPNYDAGPGQFILDATRLGLVPEPGGAGVAAAAFGSLAVGRHRRRRG